MSEAHYLVALFIAPQTPAAANAFAYRYGAVPGKWCVAKTDDPDDSWKHYTEWLGAQRQRWLRLLTNR